MDKKDSEFVVSYMYVSKLLKDDPKQAIKYIKEHRELFKISDEILQKMEEESLKKN
jgi:hypothetical protein